MSAIFESSMPLLNGCIDDVLFELMQTNPGQLTSASCPGFVCMSLAAQRNTFSVCKTHTHTHTLFIAKI